MGILKLLSEYDITTSKVFEEMGLEAKETAFSIIRKNKIKNNYIGWAAYDFEPYSVDVLAVKPEGKIITVDEENPMLGLRPAIKYSEIKALCENQKVNEKGILEVEFGEYPQSIVEKDEKNYLNALLLTGGLQETGKTYKIFAKDVTFRISTGPELIEDDEEFIIIKEVKDEVGNKYVKRGNDWFKVEPLKWYVDEKRDFAITENIITGGMPYGRYVHAKLTPEEEEWERSHPRKLSLIDIRTERQRQNNPSIIEGYLNVVLSRDIIPSGKEEYLELSQNPNIKRPIDPIKRSSISFENIDVTKLEDILISTEIKINKEQNTLEVVTTVDLEPKQKVIKK